MPDEISSTSNESLKTQKLTGPQDEDSSLLPKNITHTHSLAPLPERSPALPTDTQTHNMPLIIAGTYKMPVLHPPIRARARPTFRKQGIIFTIAICLILTTAFTQGVVNNSTINSWVGNFSAMVGAQQIRDPNGHVDYIVRTGDSLESIAAHFNVTINGIYKLNNFHIGDDIAIGQMIKIPNDPSYGKDYMPTAPITSANYPNAPTTSTTSSSIFTSYASYSTGGLCAPPSQTNLGFGLIQPEPGAKWIRGFTWYHDGVDLSNGAYGTPILAAQDGQVIFAGWDIGGGGDSVKINHCWGLATSYCHMEKLLIANGQFVHKGDIVGLQGATGNATGPHVHLMVWWHNQYVDPLQFYTHLGFPYP
jgi:murein DD-endopeptidase MepM/ murein hydrolase activator NlpD